MHRDWVAGQLSALQDSMLNDWYWFVWIISEEINNNVGIGLWILEEDLYTSSVYTYKYVSEKGLWVANIRRLMTKLMEDGTYKLWIDNLQVACLDDYSGFPPTTPVNAGEDEDLTEKTVQY
ncbi:hypothetical protein M422DRAFT_272766 [Sphaerobolus stellatus SS14]|uniref:Uncharacterized protein n=1 Tax=Sphaerobolus stellatus (strain SS14) TaxID=990650 RepID=A0A0C9ULN0_SPHS4|nr:hypothetical protein M422DRAFT_272766 [Sphaerobolus stellatus SS14]